MRARHVGRFVLALAKGLLALVLAALVLVALLLASVETSWGKNQLRSLIVRQANRYLTATLDIGRLRGSLFTGLQLDDVRLERDGRPLVTIGSVALQYSLRDIWERGVVVRRLRLVRPRVVASRDADGRWDLGTLVKRETRQGERTGPGRSIELSAIEVVDGTVTLNDAVSFGAAHIPTQYDALNVSCAFTYRPVGWRLSFADASFRGTAPDLTIDRMSGQLGNGDAGFVFRGFAVRTPRSAFSIDGAIEHERHPTLLDLRVHAERFAFQEWGGVIHGLANIAVDSSFDTVLHGPVTALGTQLTFASNGGSIRGRLVLDTSEPGWHGRGQVDVAQLDLARWLNRADRPSDITGRVGFDLALGLGLHFPRGTYTFDGPHAAYMGYAGDNVRARGDITTRDVRIASATARAYGADVTTTNGSIGLDDPFPYRFQGTAAGLDLRRLPASIPVPHVETVLAFDYDVSGRFSNAFITGRAQFARSTFVGATVHAGTVGSLDSSVTPLAYSGDGAVDGLDLHRLGDSLDIAVLREPRYRGVVSGRFRVNAVGTDREALRLTGEGRIAQATLFGGTLSDAAVSIDIADGNLHTSYDGAFAHVDPSIAFDDPRLAATLTGRANVRVGVRNLLNETPSAADYAIDGSVDLDHSTARGVAIDRAHVDAAVHDASLTIARLSIDGPTLAGTGHGTVALAEAGASDFTYDVTRADLAALHELTGRAMSGVLTTAGRLTGPWTTARLAGHGSVEQLDAYGLEALTVDGDYGVSLSPEGFAGVDAQVKGRASFAKAFDVSFLQIAGSAALSRSRLDLDLALDQAAGRNGTIKGAMRIDPDRNQVALETLAVAFGASPWTLAPAQSPPTVTWTSDEITVTPVAFTGTAPGERIAIAGTWRPAGGGGLHVTATDVQLETLPGAFERPARYGGRLDADGTLSGTRTAPLFSGTVSVRNGRIRRLTYDRLAARINYRDGIFDVDARLDQSSNAWITAVGTVPLALVDRQLPERPIDLAIHSSPISLGLLEGLTDVVSSVNGQLHADVRLVGTSRDPHFEGTLDIDDATFLVAVTGARYRNARAHLRLQRDRMIVDIAHIEDAGGNPLDLTGSLGTRELTTSTLTIDAVARKFTVMRDEFGTVAVDAQLRFRGQIASPVIEGQMTIESGNVKVDEIMQRVISQPYATTAAEAAEVLPAIDPLAALNPWGRVALSLELHVPNTLRLTGEDVQVSAGAPIGLGNINLRVAGDLWLIKDPGQPLGVYGSLDQIAGTYSFQGRQFTVQPDSSINFRGDLSPDLYVTVGRTISGVETRVTVLGELRNPELRLASTPPLDQSNILSLIVFNTSTNQLSAAQQQELAIRAGALAAGFLATPLVSALSSSLGLDILTIEPPEEFATGPKVTVGEELAPGLVARFSHQFGVTEYNEAIIEYYLSRILQIRATFSDASSANLRSPFVRIERAGIDLLFFFSF